MDRHEAGHERGAARSREEIILQRRRRPSTSTVGEQAALRETCNVCKCATAAMIHNPQSTTGRAPARQLADRPNSASTSVPAEAPISNQPLLCASERLNQAATQSGGQRHKGRTTRPGAHGPANIREWPRLKGASNFALRALFSLLERPAIGTCCNWAWLGLQIGTLSSLAEGAKICAAARA